MHNWNDINGDFHTESAMDFLPREQLRRIQSQRLAEIVKLAYERVPLHRKRMDELGVKPADIKSIDDISKLPFTQKATFATLTRTAYSRSIRRILYAFTLRAELPASR